MRHLGIRPESEIPPSAKREYKYTRKVAGREVKYYECWIDYDENEVKPVFKADEKPSRAKIKKVERMLKGWKEHDEI